MVKEYYKLRGLDANGVPTMDVLKKTGLTALADKLHGGK